MTTVWVLLATYVSQPFFGPISIRTESVVFESAERCLRNVPNIKEQLKQYDPVKVECSEQEINKGK